MKYYLKQKDNLVAEVEYSYNERGILTFKNEIIHNKKMLPFRFKSMKEFIESRKPPKNREFVEKLEHAIYGDEQNKCKHIDTTLGLSLNDTYWILPEDKKI